MVGHEELDLVGADGVLVAEAAVPAVHVAGLLGPQHVDLLELGHMLLLVVQSRLKLLHALSLGAGHLGRNRAQCRQVRLGRGGIGVLLELLRGLNIHYGRRAVPFRLAVQQRLGDHRARDLLLGGIEHAALVGHRERRRGGAGDGLLADERGVHIRLLDAGFAQALKAKQVGVGAAGLEAVGALDGAGAEVHRCRGEAGAVARVGLDGVLGDAGALGGPGGRLGDALLVGAEHVGLDLVQADGVGVAVLLVVEALGEPHVHDGEVERRVGVGQNRDPLVVMAACRVVAERIDHDELLAAFLPELEQTRPQLGGVVLRELPVACGERDHIGMLGDVAQHVPGIVAGLRRSGHAQALVAAAAPEVLGAPVPALDGVGRAHLAGVAAQLAHQRGVHAAARMQVLGLAVAVLADGQHRVRAVCVDDAPDLGFHDVERLVPADAHVLGLATVGGVDL